MYPSSTMSVERFKTELSELLHRFATTDCITAVTNTVTDKNNSADGAPLTSQKIIEAVQEVFSLTLDVNLVGSMRRQAAKPASGMVMTVPDELDIPKQNVDRNGGVAERNRSLDRLWLERLRNPSSDKPSTEEPSPLDLKINDNIITIEEADTRVTDRKACFMLGLQLMPKSSSEATPLVRSGTFVRENASGSFENGDIFEKKNVNSPTINGGSECSGQDLSEILKKLKILRDSATDVVNKIDDIHEGVMPENIQPVRCLSGLKRTSIIEKPIKEEVLKKIDDIILDVSAYGRPVRRLSDGCYPGLSRAALPEKSIVRPKMIRKSIPAAFPKMSTISCPGLNEPIPENVSLTRKSPSITNVEVSKSPLLSTSRSISSSSLALSKKSVARYSSPGNGSQARGINTQKKSLLCSPSLSSLNLKSSTVGNQPKNRMHMPVQTVKAAIGLGKRKTY